MNTPEKIIIHGGETVHDDELIASAIVMGYFKTPIPIYRRPPTDQELANPNIWVLDVGMQLNEIQHNFDHHQDKGIDASFILVSRFLEVNLKPFKWSEGINLLDTKGPFFVSNKYFKGGDIRIIYSPILEFMLLKIGKYQVVPTWFCEYLCEMGKYIISQAKDIAIRIEDIKERGLLIPIKNNSSARVLLYINKEDPTFGIEEYKEESKFDIPISVTYDTRDMGYTLYRHHDDKRVNFSSLCGDEVLFAHKGGFIAKLKNGTTIENIMKYIRSSFHE
jgi:hypothetical protein